MSGWPEFGQGIKGAVLRCDFRHFQGFGRVSVLGLVRGCLRAFGSMTGACRSQVTGCFSGYRRLNRRPALRSVCALKAKGIVAGFGLRRRERGKGQGKRESAGACRCVFASCLGCREMCRVAKVGSVARSGLPGFGLCPQITGKCVGQQGARLGGSLCFGWPIAGKADCRVGSS